MANSTISSKLGITFLLVTILPAMILCFLAAGSIEREAALVEKHTRVYLESEVDGLHAAINNLLKDMHSEIDFALSAQAFDKDPQDFAAYALAHSAYVVTPFVLSPSRDLVYPSAGMSAPSDEFLRVHAAFFRDHEQLPYYQTVAAAQRFENVSPADQQILVSRNPQEMKKVNYRQVFTSDQSWEGKKSAPVPAHYPKSRYVSDLMSFSQIMTMGDIGFIPRIVEGRLNLLFWRKDRDGRIFGALVDDKLLIKTIAAKLPPLLNQTRLLTVLDQNGQPLVMPAKERGRDWRQAFVAKEISRVLPNWEIATYLVNPDEIYAQADRVATLVRWLIFAMVVVIDVGGFLVLKALAQNMRLAQQKATFATNVSHELKTPLTSIRMFTELLLGNREVPDDKKKKYLQIILAETERLSRLINNVLDFSRLGTKQYQYKMQDVDLNQLALEIVETQRLYLESKGFIITFNTPSSPVHVIGDAEAIKQALLNLISNAEKYSETLKEITVRVGNDGPWAYIDVADKGIGVSESEREKIFEEFYRIDDQLTAKTRGTGVGLTIARKILRDHKGDVICIVQKEGSLFD